MRSPLARPAADDLADGVAQRGDARSPRPFPRSPAVRRSRPHRSHRAASAARKSGVRLLQAAAPARISPPLQQPASFVAVEATASEAAASRACETNCEMYSSSSAIALRLKTTAALYGMEAQTAKSRARCARDRNLTRILM